MWYNLRCSVHSIPNKVVPKNKGKLLLMFGSMKCVQGMYYPRNIGYPSSKNIKFNYIIIYS